MSPDAPEQYDACFHAEHREGARRSARRILPLVLGHVPARSAVDVGCGSGAWLAVLAEHGVTDVLGIDGPGVGPDALEIPADRFLQLDLREPVRLARRFDLVLCLEVAEHLPEECADGLVESLVALGPCVLFSAAIPGQGGTGHVNERWPQYWIARFAVRGYRAIDCVRPQVWADPEVEPWYAQNALLFAAESELARWPTLARALAEPSPAPLDLVHPRLYEPLVERAARETARALAHHEIAGALEAEVARLKQVVFDYDAEVQALKDERDGHRAKAEAFAVEVESLKADLAHQRGRAESFYSEVEQLKSQSRGAGARG